MAREAYRSLYGDLAKLKDTSLLDDPAGGTGEDDEMFPLLLAVSEFVDRYCNRHFYPLTTTRYFDGTTGNRLMVPELISVTSLKEDTNGDGTYNVTWAAADYALQPDNAEPTTHWGGPHTAIRATESGTK